MAELKPGKSPRPISEHQETGGKRYKMQDIWQGWASPGVMEETEIHQFGSKVLFKIHPQIRSGLLFLDTRNASFTSLLPEGVCVCVCVLFWAIAICAGGSHSLEGVLSHTARHLLAAKFTNSLTIRYFGN